MKWFPKYKKDQICECCGGTGCWHDYDLPYMNMEVCNVCTGTGRINSESLFIYRLMDIIGVCQFIYLVYFFSYCGFAHNFVNPVINSMIDNISLLMNIYFWNLVYRRSELKKKNKMIQELNK